MKYICYHMIAFYMGCLLDLLIGDPQKIPHPVRLIGALIGRLDRTEREKCSPAAERRAGGRMVAIVLTTTMLSVAAVTVGAYLLHPYAGIGVEAVLICYLLAARSLRDESMKVYRALSGGDLAGARSAVSMIVGRETAQLNEAGVTRAAVETVAENTSDGVIAPMLYAFLGGPILGWGYKAVNTMDSMVGYKNERYLNFGRTAAKADDAVNYLPARATALLMVLAAFVLGREYSGRNAWRIFKRDRYNHASPNSAQSESACAGALGVRLGGPAVYFGKPVEKPTI